MKFTIFTGFYNFIDTFDELVESVLSQTYTNWEWIICDDFSSNVEVDKKLKELENRPDTFWKIKRVHPTFKKEFYFNPPVKYATGDIFMIVDSDDMMHPKLLEVYAYNFNKFPNAQLISANSIIRNDTIDGNLRSFRHIYYNKNKNLLEAMKDTTFEYNWGDCRAWRNNIKLFDTENKWKYCGDDLLKMLINEEKGEILYLPRTLCTYAYRNDSISHLGNYGNEFVTENDNIKQEAQSRVDRNTLNSINKFYDNSYYETRPFYLSKLNFEKEKCKIEYFSSSCSNHDKEILKSLYFDHNLFFEKTDNIDYLVMKISGSEIKDLINRLNRGLPKKQLIIEVEDNISDQCDIELRRIIPNWYWFRFIKHYYIIDF